MNSIESAKLAEQGYEIGKGTSYQKINHDMKVQGLDYSVVPEHSHGGVATFKHNSNPDTYHIAHKGTQPTQKTGVRDVVSDLKIAFGKGSYSRQAKARKNFTEKVVDAIDPKTLTMSGHSLGGFTLNHTLAKSKKVRDKLLMAHTYNAGSSFAFNNEMKVSGRTKNDLKHRVIQHRTRGDIVSKGLTPKGFGVPFGTLKEYKVRPNQDEVGHEKLFKKYNDKMDLKSQDELKKMGWGSKALYAHHLSHFTERKPDPVEDKPKKKVTPWGISKKQMDKELSKKIKPQKGRRKLLNEL